MNSSGVGVGRLRAAVELARGSLHRVSAEGECLVYRVFAALRDERWATPEPETRLVNESQSRYAFESDYSASGFELSTTTVIEFEPTSVRVHYEALVHEPLLRNRLGLCVLLPATLSGTPFLARGDGGLETKLTFPDVIAPHQPCTDIRELEFVAGDDVVTIRFRGDSFEMEDQRNWTDFSYKIYCTPLSVPRPVRLEAGDRVEQSIEISLNQLGTSRRSWPTDRASSAKTFGAAGHHSDTTIDCRVPLIGTRRTAGNRLALPIDYYRVDSREPGDLDAANAYATHVYLWGRSDNPVAGNSHVIFLAAADPVTAAVRSIHSATVDSQAHGLTGTDGAFAELNRERPVVRAGETVVFTICPQVHDTDDEALIDNLFGIRAVLESAKRIYPNRDIGIGLLELTPHFNPAAGDRTTNEAHRRSDVRLRDGFALAWGFAAICELAAAGASFVTLFDDHGPHGFSNAEGTVPAARLLRDVPTADRVTVVLPAARIGPDRQYLMRVPEDRSVATGRRLLAANLGEREWTVTAESLLGEDDSASRDSRWSVEVIVRDAGPAPESADSSHTAGLPEPEEGGTPEFLIESGQTVSLPPVSYARLLEVS